MAELKRKGQKPTTDGDKTSNLVYTNLTNGGEYEARLVYVADLGLHKREFKGEVKSPCQKVSLGFEIIGETIKTEDGQELPRILWTKPFNVFFTMSDKGRELEYYKLFDPVATENTNAKWGDQLGKPCSITVVNVKSGDKVYDNIAAISPIPSKYQSAVGDAITTPCIGDSDDQENVCTKALFGLARWVYNNRIVEGSEEVEEEQEPYEEEVPF